MSVAVSITTSTGAIVRWGPGEAPGRVVQDLTFTTSMPGGFDTATMRLARGVKDDVSDLTVLSEVRIYTDGDKTVWEGRISDTPASYDGGLTITVNCVGFIADLARDKTYREIFIDRALSRWRSPTTTRQMALTALPVRPNGPQIDNSRIRLSIPGYAWATNNGRPYCEAMYWGGSQKVARVGGTYRSTTANSTINAPWVVQALSADDIDITTNFGSGSNLAGSPTPTAATAWSYSPASPRSAVCVQMSYPNTSTGTSGDLTWEVTFENTYVLGSHGLTLQGSTPATYGVLASDVIKRVVSVQAPHLSTAGVTSTAFSIPHLVYLDPTTGWEVMQAANAYHYWDLAVWDAKTVYYASPSAEGNTWQVRLSEGATMQLAGDSAQEIINGVVVQYTDVVTGGPRTVGPTGAKADATSSALADSSVYNPANTQGLRAWDVLGLSLPTSQLGATTIGAAHLAYKQLATRKGQVTVTGWVDGPQGIPRHCSEIRAGQYLTVLDHSPGVARRITATSYDHSREQATLTLDSSSNKMDAIIARLALITGGGA